jgi:hypothetical protein
LTKNASGDFPQTHPVTLLLFDEPTFFHAVNLKMSFLVIEPYIRVQCSAITICGDFGKKFAVS